MIGDTTRPLPRRVLLVDDELAAPATAGGRAVRGLADELRMRGVEVIEAFSVEDGLATTGADSAIHCIFVNWTLGTNDRDSHAQATGLLRAIRSRNAKVPIILMADRAVAGTISIEVATLVDEFVWILEDTAAFIGGRAVAALERYIQGLLPPFAAALARYDREREYSWAAPGHQGGIAFLKSAVGRAFFDFYGENLFRTDMGIERGALGSLLGHTGPIGESERYAARVFGAHRSYSVLNGTSGSNRAIMSACVGDGEIALCDRNCHKSIEQGLVNTGGIPVFLSPTRNRFGIIGPIPPSRLDAWCDREEHRVQPAGRDCDRRATGVRGAHELHLRRDVLQRRRRREATGQECGPDPLRRGMVRLRPVQPDVSEPVRDAGQPCGSSGGRTDRLRHALDPQAARGAVTDFVHPHSRRPGRHRSRPLQRGLLLPGEHVAALCTDCLQRRRGGHDGRAGRAGPDPGGHRRGRGVSPGGCAHPARDAGEEAVVLRPLERRGDPAPEDRQANSLPQGSRRAAFHRAFVLGAASG